MTKVAVLDDYQGVALEMADWSSLPDEVEVDVFSDHLSDEDDVAERLRPYDAVVAMRERTPFRREPARATAESAPAGYDGYAQRFDRRGRGERQRSYGMRH